MYKPLPPTTTLQTALLYSLGAQGYNGRQLELSMRKADGSSTFTDNKYLTLSISILFGITTLSKRLQVHSHLMVAAAWPGSCENPVLR